MATVLEECSTEEHRSFVRFLWGNGINANNIHNVMFSVYGGKCFTRKAVHNWVEKFSQGRLIVADDARPGARVVEITVKRFLCCELRRTGKEMGQLHQCQWRMYR
jgi:hypothetical protein